MVRETREDVKVSLDAINFAEEVNDEVQRDWMVQAKCRGMDAELADAMFFPQGSSDPLREQRHRLCGSCPVQRHCELYGTVAGRQYGAWGGYTSDERRNRRRVRFAQEVRAMQDE